MKTYYRFCQTYIFLLLLSLTLPLLATEQPEYSTAGFFELPHTGRKAYNMNPA